MAKKPAVNPDPPLTVASPVAVAETAADPAIAPVADDGTAAPEDQTPELPPQDQPSTDPTQVEQPPVNPPQDEPAMVSLQLLCALDDGQCLIRAGAVVTVTPERARFLLERKLAKTP